MFANPMCVDADADLMLVRCTARHGMTWHARPGDPIQIQLYGFELDR